MRSIVKGEVGDEAKDVQLGDGGEDPLDNGDIGGTQVNDESTMEDSDGENGGTHKVNDESTIEDSEEIGNNTCEPKSGELSYYQRREKNIEELKRILDEVKAKHPITKDQPKKDKVKKMVSKKKAHSAEPAVRRTSQRHKGRR